MFRGSGLSSGKPYTAVTQYIERLTGPEYDEDDLTGLIDLIEVVKIQDSGPTEAARAIRKKLKYGSTDRQLRALTILDALIGNAGSRFQRTFADEPLLERLRMLPNDEIVDIDVRKKCNQLYKQWAVAYKDTRGLESIAKLYKQLPNKARPAASQSKVIRETEQEAAADAANTLAGGRDTPEPTSGHRRNVSHSSAGLSAESSSSASPRRASHANVVPPSSGTSTPPSSGGLFGGGGHSKKPSKTQNKAKPFNLEKEKPSMLQAIAGASVASTNLTNSLKHINRESQRVSEDSSCVQRFEQCKLLRRQILRYIQLVESDQWIGSLLTANDELVKALMAYEVMDKSVDDDSDSEAEGTGWGEHAGQLFNEAGVPIPPRRGSRIPDEHLGAPAQQPPRKSSLAAGMANLTISQEHTPAMPPRRSAGPAPAIPTQSVATPSAGGASGRGKAVQEGDDDDVQDIDENDPFGDQNAIR